MNIQLYQLIHLNTSTGNFKQFDDKVCIRVVIEHSGQSFGYAVLVMVTVMMVVITQCAWQSVFSYRKLLVVFLVGSLTDDDMFVLLVAEYTAGCWWSVDWASHHTQSLAMFALRVCLDEHLPLHHDISCWRTHHHHIIPLVRYHFHEYLLLNSDTNWWHRHHHYTDPCQISFLWIPAAASWHRLLAQTPLTITMLYPLSDLIFVNRYCSVMTPSPHYTACLISFSWILTAPFLHRLIAQTPSSTTTLKPLSDLICKNANCSIMTQAAGTDTINHHPPPPIRSYLH